MPNERPSPEPPDLRFFARFTIRVATPVETGTIGSARHRIIHITGGAVEGPAIRGEVLPAGADFQVIRSDTTTDLLAKYAIRTDDDEVIIVENAGVRTASPADVERIAASTPVDPERVYFRCVPRLTASGSWSWLEDRVFIGAGQRFPDRVQVDVFEVL